MSKWAQAKQVIDLDWRQEWRHIAQGTMGELDAETASEALALIEHYRAAITEAFKAATHKLEPRQRLPVCLPAWKAPTAPTGDPLFLPAGRLPPKMCFPALSLSCEVREDASHTFDAGKQGRRQGT